MVGHDRASVRRDKVAMSDADQGELDEDRDTSRMSSHASLSPGFAWARYFTVRT